MISIIVPVYQSEETLERCINSLTKQTFRDIEIIMIVNGPPDGSGILAQKLAEQDHRIRVINQKASGVSAARNCGLDEARGEYIQFVDSDDYLAPNACEKLLLTMQQEQSDLVICGFYHLYFGRKVLKLPNLKQTFPQEKADSVFLLLYREQFLNMPWNKLYKKEKIKSRFEKEVDLGEDLLFNLAYWKESIRFSVIQDALYYYIQDGRGTTLSTKKRENRMDHAIQLYLRIHKFFCDMYPHSDTNGIFETRLTEEFLDELEGLAFEKTMNYREKTCIIKSYYKRYKDLQIKEGLSLKLLDYKIIYYSFIRKNLILVYLLIHLRAVVVNLLRRKT